MIANSWRRPDFADLARYLEHGRNYDETGRVAWWEPRNLAAETIEAAAEEMAREARLNDVVADPVYHLEISFPPEEKIAAPTMILIIDGLCERLALDEHQAVYVAHNDKPHAHVHGMINLIHPWTHFVWDDHQDHMRIERALREMERDLGLRETPGRLFQLPGQGAPSRAATRGAGEYRRTARTGQESVLQRARRAVPPILAVANDIPTFTMRLAAHGLHWKRTRRGLVIGDGTAYAAISHIADGASLSTLEARFGQRFTDFDSPLPSVRDTGFGSIPAAAHTSPSDRADGSGDADHRLDPRYVFSADRGAFERGPASFAAAPTSRAARAGAGDGDHGPDPTDAPPRRGEHDNAGIDGGAARTADAGRGSALPGAPAAGDSARNDRPDLTGDPDRSGSPAAPAGGGGRDGRAGAIRRSHGSPDQGGQRAGRDAGEELGDAAEHAREANERGGDEIGWADRKLGRLGEGGGEAVEGGADESERREEGSRLQANVHERGRVTGGGAGHSRSAHLAEAGMDHVAGPAGGAADRRIDRADVPPGVPRPAVGNASGERLERAISERFDDGARAPATGSEMKASPEPAKRFEIVDLEDGRVAIRDHQTGTTHLTTGRDDAVHDIAHLELCASEGDEQEIATHLAFNAATAERSFLATHPELAAPSPVPQPDDPAAAIIALAKTWKDAIEADRAGVAAIAEQARLNAVARELAGAEREVHLRRAEVSSTMAELFSDPDHAASRLATRGMALSLGDLARDPALISPLATNRTDRVQRLSAQLTLALQAAARAQEVASTHRSRAEALVGAGEPLIERLRSRADELMETAERRPNTDVLLALGESVRGHLDSANAMTRARVATTVPETAELVRRETRGIGL